MNYALYLNGVFETVLDEIMQAQINKPGKTFYLQPYRKDYITKLKENPPTPDSPISLFISITNDLSNISYIAEIVGWEDKQNIDPVRFQVLNDEITKHQKKEERIYLELDNGKKCANLISIRNLKKLNDKIKLSNLILISSGKPHKTRTTSGGYSYVYDFPILLEKGVEKAKVDKEFEENVEKSFKDNEETRLNRLEKASKKPEKIRTYSTIYKRNPDVVAQVLHNAHGICQLCHQKAPFIKASDGNPYLEVHHWISLSDGGEDSIENAAALCPNCHKRAHFGKDKDNIWKFRELYHFH